MAVIDFLQKLSAVLQVDSNAWVIERHVLKTEPNLGTTFLQKMTAENPATSLSTHHRNNQGMNPDVATPSAQLMESLDQWKQLQKMATNTRANVRNIQFELQMAGAGHMSLDKENLPANQKIKR